MKTLFTQVRIKMFTSASLLVVTCFVLVTSTAIAQEKERWDQIGIIREPETPKELLDFTVTVSSEEVNLKWIAPKTESATVYAIERSLDNLNFKGIGVKNGVESPVEILYTFKDKRAINGNIYYRMRKVSYEGDITMSKVISVFIDITDKDKGILGSK